MPPGPGVAPESMLNVHRPMPRIPLTEVITRSEVVAREVVAPNAVRNDAEARWPEEDLRALLDAGLGGLVVPERNGGLGHGLLALGQVCEELALHSASTALCFGMHSVGAAVIATKVTPHQEHTYLAPICEGRHLTTLALSEPGTGVHFYLSETDLQQVPGGYRVTGTKSFVTNGAHADSYVVSTRAASADAGPGDFTCLLIPASSHLRWGPEWHGLGMRGNSSRSLTLPDVFVPRENLLGQEGDEIWYVFNVVAPYFLIAMAGTYLGLAEAALREARASISARVYAHSGRTAAHQPIVQHRLGTLWAKVQRTRLLIRDAAVKGDTAAPDALVALCVAKAEVAGTVVDVVNEAMTLVGGRGYSEEASPLFRYLRDARAAHVMTPTTDLLYSWAGRALLNLPLLVD